MLCYFGRNPHEHNVSYSLTLTFSGEYGIPRGYRSPGLWGTIGGGRLYLLRGGGGTIVALLRPLLTWWWLCWFCFFFIPSSAFTIRFKTSLCEGRDGGRAEDARNGTGVGGGCCGGSCWSRVIIGGADRNCGDVGGRVTGVVVRDGDSGRFEVMGAMGIAAIRWCCCWWKSVVLAFVRSGGRHVNRIRGGRERKKRTKVSVKGKIQRLA